MDKAMLEYLQERIAHIDALTQKKFESPEFSIWRSEVERWLERVFG